MNHRGRGGNGRPRRVLLDALGEDAKPGLVLLDDAGTLVGGYGCDSPGNDRGVSLATTPDGRIALVGNTSPGGGCVRLPGATPGGFVRLMVLDAQGELRPLVVEH